MAANWKTPSCEEYGAIMTNMFEKVSVDDTDIKCDSVPNLEKCKIICDNADLTETTFTQCFDDENSCTTASMDNELTNDNIPEDFSETEEEYLSKYELDDFKPNKSSKVKHDNTPNNKISKRNKADKLQPRQKTLVRYKSIPVYKFDKSTKFLLEKLLNSRHMSRYSHIIGTGKNSVVLYGNSSWWFSKRMPWEVVVKVYENDKKNTEALHAKVQNEHKSLDRLRRCRINVPQPVCAWRNIIVMGAIGFGQTAKSITTAESSLHLNNYLDVIDSMKRMYQIAKIVHGNLSSKTILDYGRPHFIGLSYSVPADHPNALNLLIKDCYSVTNIFKDKDIPDMKTAEELFKFVTDLPEIDNTLLKTLKSLKPSDVERNTTNYNSLHSTEKSAVNYDSILKFCTSLRYHCLRVG